jgi:DNA-binding PadR family transcriptional regulator
MSTRLVILGLLRQRPLYGYEIKHIIEEHMGDWTNIAFGSIYFALDKLAEEGAVEKVATEQQGNRPSRSVYQITEAGRAEFLRLLRRNWSELERHYFDFDVGVAFMDALPVEDVREYLRGRVEALEATLKYIDAHQREELGQAGASGWAAAIFDHARVHMAAELAWTRDLLDKVERGEFA